MCIVCELLLDAGWVQRAENGDLIPTEHGYAKLAQLYDAAIEQQAGHELNDDDRLAERADLARMVAERLHENSRLAGEDVGPMINVPRKHAEKATADIKEQVEIGKLLGQLPATVEVRSVNVVTAVKDGKVYAWNMTAIDAWLAEHPERVERLDMIESGLGEHARDVAKVNQLDQEYLQQLSAEEAYAQPVIAVETDQGIAVIDGLERAVRLIFAHQRYCRMLTLTADESAQFMLIDGQPVDTASHS